MPTQRAEIIKVATPNCQDVRSKFAHDKFYSLSISSKGEERSNDEKGGKV